MLRRDYIMKLIQQLLDSLFLLLNEKGIDDDERRKRLDGFYRDYLGRDKDFYHSNEIAAILGFLETKYGDEILHRVEMLSEIMYQDAQIEENGAMKISLLNKTLALLLYLDDNGNTYSLVRQGKVNSLREELESLPK